MKIHFLERRKNGEVMRVYNDKESSPKKDNLTLMKEITMTRYGKILLKTKHTIVQKYCVLAQESKKRPTITINNMYTTKNNI